MEEEEKEERIFFKEIEQRKLETKMRPPEEKREKSNSVHGIIEVKWFTIYK